MTTYTGPERRLKSQPRIIAAELGIEVPDESESLTTEKLAERVIAALERMTPEEKAVVRKYLNGGSK